MSNLDRSGPTKSSPEFADGREHAIPSVWPPMEAACCFVLAGLLLWQGIIPAWRVLNTDFPNYYLVARLLREGYGLDRIYDWIWLQRIKDHWALDQSLVGFAGLTPFSALPVVPLSIFSAIVAKRLWILANLLFLTAVVELLNQVTSLGRRRIWALCLLAVIPLRTNFLYGQMHLLVLLLLVLAYYFHRNRRPLACGVCLSIAGSLKVYPLLLGVYFVWKKQWRSALAMVAAMFALVAIGYLWLGSSVLKIYATQILPRSLAGEVLDPYSVRAASGAALFHRLFIFEPILNPTPLFNAPSLYAILYPLWQLAIFLPVLALVRVDAGDPERERVEWATFVFTILLLSPVPSSYHFVVMIFSVVLLVDVLLARNQHLAAVLALGLYCSISSFEFFPISGGSVFSFATLVAFARLWLALLLWTICLFSLRTVQTPRSFLRMGCQRRLILGLVFVIAWVGGAVGYLHHFTYLKEEMGRRIPNSVSTFLATGLRPALGGYVFTAMVSDGYRVLDQTGRAVEEAANERGPVDQLSVAVSGNSSVQMLELADATGSRIANVLSVMPSAKETQRAPLLILDAESPALSAEGDSVAFIRELKGRGNLWIAQLHNFVWTAPTEVVGSPYDVRDVTFASSGHILFAAKVNDRISIFTMTPGKQPALIASPDEDMDSPAVSPDERFVGFRKLVHNRWQLGYMDLATRREKMLTFGDCNAYAPSWIDPLTIAYATDCGRGLGLSALAQVRIGRARTSGGHP
jgi:Glycosyltransferase family 87